MNGIKLYDVDCHDGYGSTRSMYVVALSEHEAIEAALAEMKRRKWKYDHHAKAVRLIAASHESYSGEPELVIAPMKETNP